MGEKLDKTALSILQSEGIDAFESYMKEHPELEVEQSSAIKTNSDDTIPQSTKSSNNKLDSFINNEPIENKITKAIIKAPIENKEAIKPVKPGTLRETIKILQPKSVVFASYSLSEWQENIMTLIMEQLQSYMSKSISLLMPDVLGEINIRIDCSKICGDDKKKALQQIEKLMEHKFEFWWQNNLLVNKKSQKVETKGVIISTYHNYVGTPYIDLVINKWSLPFLLYFGPGIGANQYLKSTALSIPGKYAKRLYKILIGYIDKGSFSYKISNLRTEFQIPDSYTTATIKRSIIMPSVEALNTYMKDMHVEAKFIVSEEAKAKAEANGIKKPPYDTIIFTMESVKQNVVNIQSAYASESEMMRTVYFYLMKFVDLQVQPLLGNYCRRMAQQGTLSQIYSKLRYYDQLYRERQMTPLKLKNAVYKLLREEAGIDLKPQKHRLIRTEK